VGWLFSEGVWSVLICRGWLRLVVCGGARGWREFSVGLARASREFGESLVRICWMEN